MSSMQFQIIDVDYILLEERPVVRIFGKTMSGETVCAFYENFYPYFYANGGDVEEFLKDEPNIRKIEKVQKKLVMGYQDPREVYRIETQNPAKTPELREKLKNAGFTPYEADILFKYRFMNDFGLHGMGWVKVEGGNGVNTNTVHTKRKMQVDKIQPINVEGNSPIKYLALDIECVSTQANAVPEAKRDPIIMISLVFSEPYKGQKSMVMSTRAGKGAVSFVSEKEMLESLINIIIEYDPDVITGYNINNFDMPYILERMRQNRISPVFGRCQKSVFCKKLMSRYKVNIVGRVVVDTFEIIKKDFSLPRYDLNSVASALLSKKKVDVKHSEIEKLWKGNREEYEKLIKYSEIDSVLALELLTKLNLLDKYIALSKISGILLQDVLGGGETTRIENFLLREFNKKGYIFPSKPDGSEIARREKNKKKELKGGFVIEPIKELHSNVAVLDFKSMYPSIIRTFNICPTTLIKDKTVENPIVSPTGAKFVPPEIQRGIIPKILEELMVARQKTKKQMKAEHDPLKKATLDAKQWALKIMANAFYGYLGYSRAKIYDMELANSVTSFGRTIIQKTKKIIEEEYKYRVVYGDTDSVMVKIHDKEDIDDVAEIASKISERITKELPGIMELEFEKIFLRFLPLTKKRYAAWKFEQTPDGWKDKIETKGIETVRRDWCGLVSDTMNKIIEIILKKNDVKGAVKYFNGVVKDLLEGKTDIEKLIITKTMTKMPKSYAGMQPHIELVKKIQTRSPNETPGLGDRIGYVIVKGLGLLSKRAEDPSYVIEHGLQIDSKYYIENQLLPPLERIFSVLGISKSELMGNGKQMGIFDMLKNNKNEKTSIDEVPVEEVTGFICEKCNKFYSHIPLSGVCECGGPFLFSSSRGPAKIAVVEN